MTVTDRTLQLDTVSLHIRDWQTSGSKTPYLLVHGLASNARTWDGVAQRLAAAGHPTVALNQRGHGPSDKPEDGYDFASVTDDLRQVIDALGWQKPIIAGQSWGGNVLLAFGARYPGVAAQLIWVDGGFLNLSSNFASWDDVWSALKPPHLIGIPTQQMRQRMQSAHPTWDDTAIDGAMGNFEQLANGTIRPNLTLDRHEQIVRAMWQQRPNELYPQVTDPVLICPVNDGSERTKGKRVLVDSAETLLPNATVHWFTDTVHDVHVDQPEKLANLFLQQAP